MNFINQYDLDALPYVDNEYDEPYMQAIVNNLILEEMRQFSPSNDYLSHLPAYYEPSFGNSEALKTAYERAVASSSGAGAENSDKCDVLKRYQPVSVQSPEGALAKDLQAWRRNLANAKVQCEYNANYLMNLEIQVELMQKQFGEAAAPPAGGNGLSALWLQHVNALGDLFEKSLVAQQSAQKRKIDEVNRTRYNEQVRVRSELVKLHKRRCVALENAGQILTALNLKK
jgi:hypothetical protein